MAITFLSCPKCNHMMTKKIFQEIEVDCCTHCNGLWFDKNEKESLEKLQGSQILDSGDRERGGNFDKIRDISCPQCHLKMHSSRLQSGDRHPAVETCEQCGGIWLDAGEFRHLQEPAKSGWLQELLSFFYPKGPS